MPGSRLALAIGGFWLVIVLAVVAESFFEQSQGALGLEAHVMREARVGLAIQGSASDAVEHGAMHAQSEALPSPATRGQRHVRPARAAGHAAYLTQLLSALASLRSAPSHESPTAKISD